MGKSNVKIINRWLESLSLERKKDPIVEGWHIDEIMNDEEYQKECNGNNKKIFFKALELFYDLTHLDERYNLYAKYTMSLVFYLCDTDHVSLGIRASDDIWNEFDYIPPEIFLVSEKPSLFIPQHEEYRKPLELEIFKEFKNDCNIYYRCMRHKEDVQRHRLEYQRDIWLNNYGRRED